MNELLTALGCPTPVGAVSIEDEFGFQVILGAQGRPMVSAEFYFRPVGRWAQVIETWNYDEALGKLVIAGYRYALFNSHPDAGVDPAYRWELHPLSTGRSGEIYGYVGFAHCHVGGAGEHIPTGAVSLQVFLRFLVAEGTDLGQDEARRLVELTRESEQNAREWRVVE